MYLKSKGNVLKNCFVPSKTMHTIKKKPWPLLNDLKKLDIYSTISNVDGWRHTSIKLGKAALHFI